MPPPASKLRDLVEARADGRCEYCQRYQELIGETFFEVEHIHPRSRGGLTIPSNLALACRRCNLLKGDATEHLIAAPVDLHLCLTHGAIVGAITSGVAEINCAYTVERQLAVQPLIF